MGESDNRASCKRYQFDLFKNILNTKNSIQIAESNLQNGDNLNKIFFMFVIAVLAVVTVTITLAVFNLR